MDKDMKDILQSSSLKRPAYEVPDGYFESMKTSMKMIPLQTRAKRHIFWRWAAAASAAILIAAGAFSLGRSARTEEFSEEDYIVYSGELTDVIYDEYTQQYAEGMSDEDIIEYLIYIGAEVEDIEWPEE